MFFSPSGSIGKHGDNAFQVMWKNVKGDGTLKCPRFHAEDSAHITTGLTTLSSTDWYRSIEGCKIPECEQYKFIGPEKLCLSSKQECSESRTESITVPFHYGHMGVAQSPFVGLAFKEREGTSSKASFDSTMSNLHCFDNICESMTTAMDNRAFHIETGDASWAHTIGWGDGSIGKFFAGEDNSLFINSRGFPMYLPGNSYTLTFSKQGDETEHETQANALSSFVIEFLFPNSFNSQNSPISLLALKGPIMRLQNCFASNEVSKLESLTEHALTAHEDSMKHRSLAMQCFAKCSPTAEISKVAFNLDGRCVCYQSSTTLTYHYKHCLDQSSTSNFFAFSPAAGEMVDLGMAAILFKNRAPLNEPRVRSTPTASVSSITMQPKLPSDDNWGVALPKRSCKFILI